MTRDERAKVSAESEPVRQRARDLARRLLERRAKQGAKSLPRGEAKRIQSLLAKVKAVFPVKR